MADTAATEPVSTDCSIEEWMRRENKRQAKREAERRATEADRYGRVRTNDRRAPWVKI